MPIYRGPQKVTPRRAGVDLARVYRGDRLVWEAIITVTPEPPVFHDGEPWVTLPDMEGVTYTVQGQPGWGASITITASAEDGYELEGTVEWGHEFGIPYPDNGSWGPRLNPGSWVTADTHSMLVSGTFTITHTVTSTSRVRARISGPGWISDSGPLENTSGTSITRALSAGETVGFDVGGQGNAYGSWSISPA